MPRKKPLPERERRRIATRRLNNGEDYDSRNARHAAQFNKTKFNSETGRAAALKRQQMIRDKKAAERGNAPGGTVL